MSTLSNAQIESAAKGNVLDSRTVLLAFQAEILALKAVTGTNLLSVTNTTQKPLTSPPVATALSVSGANGAFSVAITNPSQAMKAAIQHEVSYADNASFQSPTVIPVSTSTQLTINAPGVDAYWRVRSSYDGVNFGTYVYATVGKTISSGLQSSSATADNVVLNQTNFAVVNSVAVGSSANIQVYGASGGANTNWVRQKGSAASVQPSATLIGIPPGSNAVVAYDPVGEQYHVQNSLAAAFPDTWIPVGSLSVVGTGTPTLPTIVPYLSGGHILGYDVTDGGAGASQPYTLTLGSTGGGTGATFGEQTISAGVLISVAPGNTGSGYSGGTTVIPSGGTGGGTPGGGQAAGGNGGRLVN